MKKAIISELTVIVPAYNEEKKIEKCVNEIVNFCTSQNFDYEIIITEDGSTDNTVDIITRLKATNTRIKVLTSRKRVGKGKAVKSGMLHATKNYVGFMDTDLSAPPKEFLRCINYIKDYDLVVGSRILRDDLGHIQRPISRTFFSYLYSFLFRILFNIPIRDTQCGFKLFNKKIIPKILSNSKISGFAFDTEMIVSAYKQNLKVKEVAIEWSHDNASKINILKQIYYMGRDIIKIRINS